MLTSPNRLTEDVLVAPVVVPKLKFGNVERQIFGADFVESADNATLEDRPEAPQSWLVWIAPTTY
jgi:hypothetical protein